jgi:hypothetical protein
VFTLQSNGAGVSYAGPAPHSRRMSEAVIDVVLKAALPVSMPPGYSDLCGSRASRVVSTFNGGNVCRSATAAPILREALKGAGRDDVSASSNPCTPGLPWRHLITDNDFSTARRGDPSPP